MKEYLMRMLLVVVALFAAFQVSARDSKKQAVICMFAYGTSFNDSTVYLSSVQVVKDASLDAKTNFLNNRPAYSSAFKQFLDAKYNGVHTTAVFFNVKRDKLEKNYLKIRRDAQKNKQTRLVEIPASDFQFSLVNKAEALNEKQ